MVNLVMRLKSPVVQLFLGASLWLFGGSAFGQAQTAEGEKIRDISPDKKFAVRVRYDAEKNRKLLEGLSAKERRARQISSDAIVAVELVKLPEKEVAEDLLGKAASSLVSYADISLIWSPGSKWFAFYAPTETRVGYTTVYHERDGAFIIVRDPEELRIDAKGGFTEHVHPVRWSQPGVLVLKQYDSGRDSDTTLGFQFTIRFDAENKFHVLNKKKIRVEAE